MEYQIGQILEINGRHKIKLVVCEHENCDNCFFIYKCKIESRNAIKYTYGDCSCLERKDGKNIIFKPISDNSIELGKIEKTNVPVPLVYQDTIEYEKGHKLFFTSDLHFCHDREFIWKARGFNNIDEMNNIIVKNWNDTVGPNDDIYVLGDLMLGGTTNPGVKYLKQLNGNIHVILGNHDTSKRIEIYKTLPNIKSVTHSAKIKYEGLTFFLTHMPCLTGNLEKELINQMTINLSGHTHMKEKFFYDLPYVYNVAVDAHGCKPVGIDKILQDITYQMTRCKEEL